MGSYRPIYIEEMAKVQMCATKSVNKNKNAAYREGLMTPSLRTLKHKCLRGDRTELYKLVTLYLSCKNFHTLLTRENRYKWN
jgi:hypothetical protein